MLQAYVVPPANVFQLLKLVHSIKTCLFPGSVEEEEIEEEGEEGVEGTDDKIKAERAKLEEDKKALEGNHSMMAEVRNRFKLTDFLYVFNGWDTWKLNSYKDQNEQLLIKWSKILQNFKWSWCELQKYKSEFSMTFAVLIALAIQTSADKTWKKDTLLRSPLDTLRTSKCFEKKSRKTLKYKQQLNDHQWFDTKRFTFIIYRPVFYR